MMPAEFPQDALLIHASHEHQLEELKPCSRSPARNLLFATCCPVFAAFHVLRYKYRLPLFLYRYSFLSLRFVLLVTREEAYEQVVSSRITFYFVERDAFVEDARMVGLLERLSLGLVRNTNVEYVTRRTVTPVARVSVRVGDLVAGRAIRLHRYRIRAALA